MISVIFPEIGNQLGWYSAEIGRQPWVVYNILRTQDGISQNINSGQVVFSLTLFALIYLLIFILFIFLLDRKIRQGPEVFEAEEYRDPFELKQQV